MVRTIGKIDGIGEAPFILVAELDQAREKGDAVSRHRTNSGSSGPDYSRLQRHGEIGMCGKVTSDVAGAQV